MSASFQERFKNRSNFIGKQGYVNVEPASVIIKPNQGQVFEYQVPSKIEYTPIMADIAMKSTYADISNNINPTKLEVRSRSQAQSANPYRNTDSRTRFELKTSQGLKGIEEYKPYTIQDYKNIKSEKYFELGGLGPSTVGTEEWKLKKELNDKRLSYSKQVKMANSNLPPSGNKKPGKEPEKEISKVEKAKQFAKKIPKPVVKEKKIENIPAVSSVLDELERQHLAYKASVDAIKSGYE